MSYLLAVYLPTMRIGLEDNQEYKDKTVQADSHTSNIHNRHHAIIQRTYLVIQRTISGVLAVCRFAFVVLFHLTPRLNWHFYVPIVLEMIYLYYGQIRPREHIEIDAACLRLFSFASYWLNIYKKYPKQRAISSGVAGLRRIDVYAWTFYKFKLHPRTFGLDQF